MDMDGYGEFSTEKSGYGWIWTRPNGVEWSGSQNFAREGQKIHDGLPDCVQISCVLREQLAIAFAQVRGEACTSARAHVHTPSPYLANGWADCVQILCVTRDQLDKSFTQVKVREGMQLHVRACNCTPFSMSYKRLGGLRSNLVRA